jgi:hypothetical protein
MQVDVGALLVRRSGLHAFFLRHRRADLLELRLVFLTQTIQSRL